VVDVSVSADDGFDGQLVTAEQFEDARDLVARIDHQRFTGDGIADDRAIALQHPDRNGDVDESLRDSVEGGEHSVAHDLDYSIHSRGFRSEYAGGLSVC
jgi:hypothetical protein